MPRNKTPKELIVSDDPKVNAQLMTLKNNIRKQAEKGVLTFLEIGRSMTEAYVLLGGDRHHVLSGRKRLIQIASALPSSPASPSSSSSHGETISSPFEEKVDRKVDARFTQWMSDLPFSPSTARRFMQSWVLRQTRLADLEAKQLALIDQSVFYDLSNNGTSDAVIQRVVERAQSGQPVKRQHLKAEKDVIKRRAPLAPPADSQAAGDQATDDQPAEDQPAEDTVEADAVVQKPDEAHESKDALGAVLPEHLVAVFDTATELEGIARRLNDERLALSKLLKTEDVEVIEGVPTEQRTSVNPGASMISSTGVLKQLKEVIRDLKEYRPHVICPTCKGAGCEKQSPRKFFCAGRGWATQAEWKLLRQKIQPQGQT